MYDLILVSPCSSRIWLSELSGSLCHRWDDYWQITNINFYIWLVEFTSLPLINSSTHLKVKIKNKKHSCHNKEAKGSHHREEFDQQTYFTELILGIYLILLSWRPMDGWFLKKKFSRCFPRLSFQLHHGFYCLCLFSPETVLHKYLLS